MIFWFALAVQVATATNETLSQDLNCNGVDAADETVVDLLDPECAAAGHPNADYFFDFGSYGCRYEVATADADLDGFSDGMLVVPVGGDVVELTVTFTCDNCPDDFNDDQSDVDCDNYGDVCDNCPDVFNDQADADGHQEADGPRERPSVFTPYLCEIVVPANVPPATFVCLEANTTPRTRVWQHHVCHMFDVTPCAPRGPGSSTHRADAFALSQWTGFCSA